VVSFRPTAAQALGRGAFAGGLVGLVLAAVALLWAGVATRLDVPLWVAVGAALLLSPLAGAAYGVLFSRDEGADIDEIGIHPVPRTAGGNAPWQRIADVRAERHGGRTHVAVYLDSGRIVRLPAPYDGAFLGRDAEFERKVFMLRHLWETHRSFVLRNHPRDGA